MNFKRRSFIFSFRILVMTSLILAVALTACNDDDDVTGPELRDLADFLPPGTATLTKAGDPRLASDVASLQDIVNGGFEVYTNNGFQEMIEQLYEGSVGGSVANVKVMIFDQGNAANAAALNEELTLEGAWEAWGEIGDEAHKSGGLFAYIILFRRDEFSIRLDIDGSTQDAKDLLELFATHIDLEITG
jgi:hypothetical protein